MQDSPFAGTSKKTYIQIINVIVVGEVVFWTLLKPSRIRSVERHPHIYATFRLHEGINQYAVARIVGTTVAMLEQLYGHTSNIILSKELSKTVCRNGVEVTERKEAGNALDRLSI